MGAEKNKILKFITFESSEANQGIELHYYAFDIDDNLFHMPTVIHMEKKIGEEWTPVDVSTADFAKFRTDSENYRLLGNSAELAFSEFRDTGPRGNLAFVEDMKIAIKNKKFGPSWDAFVKCLVEGAIFALITARGNEPSTYRSAVEYIIDNVLSKMPSLNPGYSLVDEMFQNLKKFKFLFRDLEKYQIQDLKRGERPSDNPLISAYLDNCYYYGVSSPSFAKEFGSANASNPEIAKELALDKFIGKCDEFGKNIGAKSVSIGFSDDDPKNVEHVRKFFKEKLPSMGGGVKLSLYKTTDPTIKGGEVTKFTETSHQTPGLESSVLPFTKWNNMTQRLYPNSKDAPFDDYHNQIKNQIGMTKDLYKKFAFKRKKNKSKK
jgi:hypothetical protein